MKSLWLISPRPDFLDDSLHETLVRSQPTEAKSEITVVPIDKEKLDGLFFAADRNVELKRLVRNVVLGRPDLAKPLFPEEDDEET